jgi:hypothetical protein
VNLFPCARHREVAAVLHQRRWPEACNPELRTHVEGCPQCGELVRVVQVLQEARRDAMREARLTPPGVLWWKAQLRRRHAEVRRVERPLVLVETLALLTALLVTVALAVARRGDLLSWFSNVSGSSVFHIDALWSIASGTSFWSLLIGSGVFLSILGGFAVYLAARTE